MALPNRRHRTSTNTCCCLSPRTTFQVKDYPIHGKGNRSLLSTAHRDGMGGGGGGRGGGGRSKRSKPMDRAVAATYGAAPAASPRSGRATKRPRRKKGPAFELSAAGADDSHRAPPPPPLGLSRPPSAELTLELDGGASGVLPPIGARVGTPIAVSDLEETNPREQFETGNGGGGGGSGGEAGQHQQHSHSHHRPPSPGQRGGADLLETTDPMRDPSRVDPLQMDGAQFETGHLDSATLMEKKMLLPYLDKVSDLWDATEEKTGVITTTFLVMISLFTLR